MIADLGAEGSLRRHLNARISPLSPMIADHGVLSSPWQALNAKIRDHGVLVVHIALYAPRGGLQAPVNCLDHTVFPKDGLITALDHAIFGENGVIKRRDHTVFPKDGVITGSARDVCRLALAACGDHT